MNFVTLLSLSFLILSCKSREYNSTKVKFENSREFSNAENDLNTAANEPFFEKNLRSNMYVFDEKEMVKVSGAKVAIADYALIRKDFSFLQGKSEAEIDDWIVRTTAYVNPNQVLAPTNEEIPIEKDSNGDKITTNGLRPVSYGRASVFRVKEEQKDAANYRLIESKGTGTFSPQLGSHSNGLSTFREALREYFYEKLTSLIFDFQKTNLKTVPVYAVLHLGFSVKFSNGDLKAAGSVVRAAFARKGEYTNESGNPLFSEKDAGSASIEALERVKKAELALRTFGISSTTHENSTTLGSFDWVNVQLTGEGRIVDFGTYGYQNQFLHPIVFPRACKGSPEVISGRVFRPTEFGCVHLHEKIYTLSTSNPEFVSQPRKNIELDASDWKDSSQEKVRNAGDKISKFSTEIGELTKNNPKFNLKESTLKFYCEMFLPILKKANVKSQSFSSTSGCLR